MSVCVPTGGRLSAIPRKVAPFVSGLNVAFNPVEKTFGSGTMNASRSAVRKSYDA